MGRFDERCPYCGERIAGLNEKMIDHDYQTAFVFECPSCDGRIDCHVHQVPEFELSKAMTDAEYSAMVRKLAAETHLCAGCNYRLIPDDVSLCKTCLR